MYSCIYEGTVRHRRHVPLEHQFNYRLYMVYLDLDELAGLVGKRALIGDSKHSWRSFLRSDHLHHSSIPLATEVRAVVEEQTGQPATGPIGLLTQLRCCGYYMSPLNLYYCFDSSRQQVQAIVAEVTNTPWRERHCYVLWSGNRRGEENELKFEHPKEFHVSPFMDMDMHYRWRLTPPASTLTVQLATMREAGVEFEADMSLTRHPLDRQQLRRMSLRYPLMTGKIVAAIYFQALKLWWKKCPAYTHPKHHHASTPAIRPRGLTPGNQSTKF